MCQTTNLLPVATTVLLPRFTLCVALHQRSSVHLHGIARLRVLRQLQNEIWLLQEMERIDTPRGIDPVHARQRWWQHDNHQRRRTTPTSTSHDGASTCGSTTVCRGTTTNVDGHGTPRSDGWANDHCTNTNRATTSSTSAARGVSRPTISSPILISVSLWKQPRYVYIAFIVQSGTFELCVVS